TEPAPDFTPPPIEPLPPPETAAFEPPPSPDFTPPPLVTLPPSDFASLAAPAARLKQPPRQRPERILELAREARPEPERRREPERRETRREQPRTERRAEQRAEQRQAEPQARQPARGRESSGAQPARQAAQGSASRAASAGQIASWQQTVGARITAHMRRTRISGGRGSVTAAVTVTIQPNGRASARLAKGSGDAHVDQALQRQANRMPRMTAPPGGQPASFTVPFRINR
ncbi:TonB C-terminal domain-containing protein, partial [Paracoccus sp. (in: a-proteobacteria)]|uniref:TonB C-terminal domain-containing protein n=1 Tax=Paracoccus sp. TaxID=267 RepID=UPI0026DF5ACB